MQMLSTILLILIPVLIAYFIISSYLRRKKIKANIEKNFGVTPSDKIDILCAKSFCDSYAKYTPNQPYTQDITWNDLDMDAVFLNINSCQSGVGSSWLYTQLRSVEYSASKAKKREELIDFFDKHPDIRRKSQYKLASLGQKGGTNIEMMLFNSELLQLKFAPLYFLLSIAPILSCLLFFVNMRIAFGVLAVFLFANIALSNAIRHRPSNSFAVLGSFSSVLLCAKQLLAVLKKSNHDTSAQLQSALAAFKKDNIHFTMLSFDDYMVNIGLQNIFSFFLLPVISYILIVKSLIKKKAESLKLVKLVGEIDTAISLLATRKMFPSFCTPTFTSEESVSFEEIYHPLLASPVSNTATFQRNVLFTGSNASGKSTFIKAIAINCILAQAINTCFAKSFFMHEGEVLTSMAIQDNISEGESYFVAELKSMRHIIKKAENDFFCYAFFDEILRGTNTIERISASSSVLSYLSSLKCLVMAASHDIELTRILHNSYDNYHFQEAVTEDGIEFDYILRSGPASTRNAIKLMKTMHFPSTVIDSSNALVKSYENTSQWPKSHINN